MCMTVTETDLGPAHAAYDPTTDELFLTPGLNGREQDHLARDVLTRAGVPQPAAGVRCTCGHAITLPAHQTRETA